MWETLVQSLSFQIFYLLVPNVLKIYILIPSFILFFNFESLNIKRTRINKKEYYNILSTHLPRVNIMQLAFGNFLLQCKNKIYDRI